VPYDPIHGQGHGGPKVLQTINYRKNPYPVYIDMCTGDQIFTVVGPYRVENKVRLSVSYDFMDFLLQFVAFTPYSVSYLCIPADMEFFLLLMVCQMFCKWPILVSVYSAGVHVVKKTRGEL